MDYCTNGINIIDHTFWGKNKLGSYLMLGRKKSTLYRKAV